MGVAFKIKNMAAHVVPYGGMKRRRPEAEAESPSPSLQGVPEALASGWDGSRLLLVLILFRIINSLLVWTRFVPDEYWQCTEVAYHVIYKYPFIFRLINFLHV